MPMVKFTPDPERPVVMSDEEKRRLASMSEAQIEANAAADPDSRPLTDEAWERGRTRRLARKAREASGLSQAKFAEAFHLNVRTVQGWESGRRTADETAVAFLEVILREPAMVQRALSRKGQAA